MQSAGRSFRNATIIGVALALHFVPLERAAATQQTRTMRIIRKDTTGRDSTMRIMIDIGALQQMTRELMTSKAMEETIAHALRAARGGQNDPARARQLEAALGKIASRNAGLISAIQMQCDHNQAPEGYLGVSIPEAYGGGGLGIAALSIVCEELSAEGCPLLLLVVW